jgi:hypothetical protein
MLQLSALDAFMLRMEQPHTPLNGGVVMVYDRASAPGHGEFTMFFGGCRGMMTDPQAYEDRIYETFPALPRAAVNKLNSGGS